MMTMRKMMTMKIINVYETTDLGKSGYNNEIDNYNNDNYHGDGMIISMAVEVSCK